VEAAVLALQRHVGYVQPSLYIAERVRLAGIVERARQLLGGDFLKRLLEAVEEGVRHEVSEILNASDIDERFPTLATKFWLRLALSTLEVSQRVLSSPDFSRKVAEVERALARELTSLLKRTGYARAEDLALGLSVLTEYDLWLLDRASEIGLEPLLERLCERAPCETLLLQSYLSCLLFAWVSAVSAVTGVVGRFREENRDILAARCREYAEEVDAYVDTVDTLLDDDAYEALKRLGLVCGCERRLQANT
jgi:hypothetical protein